MFRSDGERRSFSIMRDMTVIGRREDCDLRIPLSDVSRKHCRLVRDGETLHLEDLGSSNGTYRNGERVQEAILSPGDTLQVGPVQFVLQIDGHPADDELAPQAGVAVAESSYDATESSAEPEAIPAYELPAGLESADLAEHGSAADALSEHATVDEPVVVEVTPPVAAARRQPPTPPPVPAAAAAAPAKKANGGRATPPPPPLPPAPAAESDEAPPFQGLEELDEGTEEQDFFIVDEPSSSSQSGEIQIDMDSPPA
jgi:predicted component of type VI protein secretion system